MTPLNYSWHREKERRRFILIERLYHLADQCSKAGGKFLMNIAYRMTLQELKDSE